jgi:tRNA G10  N-methylase Trm11
MNKKQFERMNTQGRILDPCCGGRMMWFDRKNPDVIFGDQRSKTITVTDNTRGNSSGTRVIKIEPDTLMDFRALPYKNETFHLVAFDPPHLIQAGQKSWLAAKYGKLVDNWRDDLQKGFAECFRVLVNNGTLVFKLNETQVKLREILALTPHKSMFWQIAGRGLKTHWLVFIKPIRVGCTHNCNQGRDCTCGRYAVYNHG